MKRPIDYNALSVALRQKVGGRLQAECARECGLDKSTFGRLYNNSNSSSTHKVSQKRHAGVTMEVVTKACNWLGMPVESFTERKAPPKPFVDTCDAIDFYLMRDPSLTDEQSAQLSTMLRAAYKTVARKEG